MARTLDVETLIEDALVDALQTYMGDDVTIARWEDNTDKDLTPMIRVKAMETEELDGTVNFFVGRTVSVDIGCFTSKRSDLDGKIANGIRSDARTLINQSDIVTTLNIKDGLLVYNNGVIPQGSVDVPDTKLWQKNFTVLVIATTVSV